MIDAKLAKLLLLGTVLVFILACVLFGCKSEPDAIHRQIDSLKSFVANGERLQDSMDDVVRGLDRNYLQKRDSIIMYYRTTDGSR
jgi:hypothetical protein